MSRRYGISKGGAAPRTLTYTPAMTARSMLAALALVVVAACRSPSSPQAPAPASSSSAAGAPAATPPGASPAPARPAPARTFGAPLTASAPVELARVLERPDGFADHPVTVEGAVRKACTRRGCWMELAPSTKEGTPGCRVTFKDYGFFVPTDSAGARARVQGTVEVATVPAARVRHLEEEGAIFAGKQPDGSAREVRIVATGVELWRPPS
jgi:hypothetical protein